MLNKDINRRDFLGSVGFASMGMMAALGMGGRRADAAEKVIPGFDDKGSGDIKQQWKPVFMITYKKKGLLRFLPQPMLPLKNYQKKLCNNSFKTKKN